MRKRGENTLYGFSPLFVANKRFIGTLKFKDGSNQIKSCLLKRLHTAFCLKRVLSKCNYSLSFILPLFSERAVPIHLAYKIPLDFRIRFIKYFRELFLLLPEK